MMQACYEVVINTRGQLESGQSNSMVLCRDSGDGLGAFSAKQFNGKEVKEVQQKALEGKYVLCKSIAIAGAELVVATT